MRILLTILFSFSLFYINAQQNDSLVNVDLNSGKTQLFYGKYNESISTFTKVLEHYRSSNNYLKIAETYNQLSEANYFNSRLPEALTNAQNALATSRDNAIDNKLEEANALDNIGVAQSSMNMLAEAYKNQALALKIRSQFFKKDHYSHAKTLFNIGVTLHKQRNLDAARDTLNKILKIKLANTPKDKILIANTYEALGYINYDESMFDEALSLFKKTYNLSSTVYKKDNPYFVKVHNDFGLIYSVKDLFNESLKYYQKALSVSISNYGVDRHPDQIRVHFNMGTVYNSINQKDKALYHTQKCLDMAKMALGENHPNLFFPYSQFGLIYGNEKGVPYIMKALDICKNMKPINNLRIAFLYNYLSIIYDNIGNYSKALEFSEKALDIRLKIYKSNNISIVRSYNAISKTYLNLNDYKKAADNNRLAINSNYLENDTPDIVSNPIKAINYLNDDLLLESIKTKADIQLALFHLNGHKDDLKESNLLYQKAASLVNSVRNKKRDYEDKIKLSSVVKSIYAKNIETPFLLNKIEGNNTPLSETFYYSEKSRANVLRELAKSADAKSIANINTEVLNLENQINLKIAKLTSQIINETSNKTIDSTKVYNLEGQLFDLTIRKDSLEKQIERNFPKYYTLKYEKNIITIPELQKQLQEETTFIEFFTSNDNIYAFIITKDSFHAEELKIKNLNKKIEAINTSIVNKNNAKHQELASNLYSELIKPIKKHVIGNKLIIVPDESLWHLQFDLLINPDESTTAKQPNYLLFDYAITYANSASMLFEQIDSARDNELLNECIAFSYTNNDSIVNTAQIDLPGSRKEIKVLSTIFKGNYYNNTDASEANFKNNVDRYKLVHLALHAEIDSLNPKHLKILFSGDQADEKEDNILFGHELYSLNIPADLVALSACNTGVGKVNKGEGILSIGNAFQYAGAKSLLLSRWDIFDETTPEVMKLFYKNIKSGMNKGEALQQAKITYLSTASILSSPPVYWGSFYILGNTDPIMLDSNPNLIYYGIGALLILIFGIFLLKKSLR